MSIRKSYKHLLSFLLSRQSQAEITPIHQDQEFAVQQDQKFAEIEKYIPNESIPNLVQFLAISVLRLLTCKQTIAEYTAKQTLPKHTQNIQAATARIESHYKNIRNLLSVYTKGDYVGTQEEKEFVQLIEKMLDLYVINNQLQSYKELNATLEHKKMIYTLEKGTYLARCSLPKTCDRIQELLYAVMQIFPESNKFSEVAEQLRKNLFNRSFLEQPKIGGFSPLSEDDLGTRYLQHTNRRPNL